MAQDVASPAPLRPISTPARRPQPVAPTERIPTLDVLRGLALLGIAVINVAAFARPGTFSDIAWHELSGLDWAVEAGKLFAVHGKFYALFALLFGVGFAMQLNRAEHRGHGFVGRFLWRMVLLLAIGSAHLVLLWDGDVLLTYAACGVLLVVLLLGKRALDGLLSLVTRQRGRKLPRWSLLVLAGLLMFGPSVGFGVFAQRAHSTYRAAQAGEPLTPGQQRLLQQLNAVQAPEQLRERAARNAELDELFAEGRYADAARHRAQQWSARVMPGPTWLFVLGMFLIGAYLGRKKVIGRAREHARGCKRLTVAGLVLGIPLSVAYVWATVAGAGQYYPWWEFAQQITRTAAGLALALAMVGAVALGMTTRARSALLQLAPLGRMALSGYLLQSLVGGLVFHGYGLGLGGQLGSLGQLLYCLGLGATLIALAHWWLRRFHFGPVEWLWRSATYGRRQPLRRRAS